MNEERVASVQVERRMQLIEKPTYLPTYLPPTFVASISSASVVFKIEINLTKKTISKCCMAAIGSSVDPSAPRVRIPSTTSRYTFSIYIVDIITIFDVGMLKELK